MTSHLNPLIFADSSDSTTGVAGGQTLVGEHTDNLGVWAAVLLVLLSGGPRVAVHGDGGGALPAVGGLLIKGLAGLELDGHGLHLGGGDHLPLAGGRLGDLLLRGGGAGGLPEEHAHAEGLQEVLVLLLLDLLVLAGELHHFGLVLLLGDFLMI